jgi:feruloyl-CoA synthase
MVRLIRPTIVRRPRPGGGFVLAAATEPPPPLRCLGDALVRWADEAPERTLFAERDTRGAWQRVSYGEALSAARSIGQGLLDLGLGPEHPLVILSGNSLDHALLVLGAMHVGVPVAAISPAYSLLSRDHEKLRTMVTRVRPGALYAADPEAFGPALRALAPLCPVPVLTATSMPSLRATMPTAAVDEAFAAITPDTVAKLLFTSGSTGAPKAVINTQRMLCANQAALEVGWPFLRERPPVIVDWLPWSHTFGANHNTNLVLVHGGTLYIDGGKPAPGLFDETLRNLREVPSTISFNVPRGFDLLVGHLERDEALRETFFRDLDLIFYAAAALSHTTWERLAAMASRVGRPIAMTSAWGSTETSPLVTQVSYAIPRAGNIGSPVPGTELAFVPAQIGDKLELRVKGPNVTPGYLREDGTIDPLPVDELGFYAMGDAGRLADEDDPSAGVIFEGRTAESFKLASGTWVHVGEVRLALLSACSPWLADAVIAGHDRDQLGALVFLAPGVAHDAETRRVLGEKLAAQTAEGASARIRRLRVLERPASIDAGEITDKGYLNQRALLTTRAADVARLFGERRENENENESEETDEAIVVC